MSELVRLLRLMRPHSATMAGGIGLGSIVVLANVGLLSLAGWFIAAMALAGLGRFSLDLFAPAAAIRGLAILRTAGRYGERLVTHDATLRLLASLRVWLFARIEPLAPAGLQRFRGGDLLARLRADVDSLNNFYLRIAAPLVTATIGVTAILIFLAWFAPGVAILDGAALLMVGVALPLLAQRVARRSGQDAIAARADLGAGVTDLLRGMGELMVYGAIEEQGAMLDRANCTHVVARRRQARLEAAANAASGFVAQAALAGSLLVLIPVVAKGSIFPADLPMLALFVLAGFEAVGPLPAALASLGEILAAAHRIFGLVDAEPAVREPADPESPPTSFAIRFEGLRLRYAGGTDWALDGIDLAIPEGGSIGIAGPSGSGKTSLLKVLLRFFDYQAGTIEIGGIPIDRLDGETVRDFCAVVAQESHLFNTTIRDNLLIADPDADEHRLRRALASAGILAEVDEMPNGLDTIVGEVGTRLSGGQARRVVIARAVLRDAPILLLDEPTEGLDTSSEALVLDALAQLMRGRTTILISHRPQALARVDAIARMENGRLGEAVPGESKIAATICAI